VGALQVAQERLLSQVQAPLATLHDLLPRSPGSGAGAVRPPDRRPGDLTPREHEVLLLLTEGLLARTIAKRLDLSTRTVETHLGNVYRKLGTHDRMLAVERARALGILPPPGYRAAGT
jgi:DNA-binding NarL/FixJ family response regulator